MVVKKDKQEDSVKVEMSVTDFSSTANMDQDLHEDVEGKARWTKTKLAVVYHRETFSKERLVVTSKNCLLIDWNVFITLRSRRGPF